MGVTTLQSRSNDNLLPRRWTLSPVTLFASANGSVLQDGYTRVSDPRLVLEISKMLMIPVEYAMEAISHAGSVLAVLAKDGVVLAAEKKVTGKLLDLSGTKEGGYGGSGEKIFLLNSYIPSLSSPSVSSNSHLRIETSLQALLVLQRTQIPS